MAGVGRVCRSTLTSVVTDYVLASVASVPSRPTSRAGGWMPRAMSRSSTMASLAPRWASTTSAVTRARSAGATTTPVMSSSRSLAMPRRMASANKLGLRPVVQVPLDPAQRRGRGVDGLCPGLLQGADTGGDGVGAQEGADEQAVEVDKAAHDPRSGEEEDDADDEDTDAVEEGTGLIAEAVKPVANPPNGKICEAKPHTGTPLPFGLNRGEVRQANVSHQRLTETKKPRIVHPAVEGEVAHRAPGDTIPQSGLKPSEEASLRVCERLRVRDLLIEKRAAQPACQDAAEAAGEVERQHEDGEAEERDGQDDAGAQRPGDDGKPDPRDAGRQDEVRQLGPDLLGEGFVKDDAGDGPGLVGLLLVEAQRELPAAEANPHPAVLSGFVRLLHALHRLHHASRRMTRHGAQAEGGQGVGTHQQERHGRREVVVVAGDHRRDGIGEHVGRAKRVEVLADFGKEQWREQGDPRERRDGAGGVADDRAQAESQEGEEGEAWHPTVRRPAARPVGRAPRSVRRH